MPPAADRLPSVSIILPVRNEAATIASAIESCLNQDYHGELDVVVADAMSSDGTRDIIASRFGSSNVRVVDNVARTTPAGLNAAIGAASGSVIVRCDAHSILPPSYVSTAVELLAATKAGNVGGIQRAVGSTPIQRGIAYAMTSPLGVGNARFHRGGAAGEVDTVFLGTFPASVLDAVGGFDEGLIRNQDYELNIRIRQAGHVVYFDPSLVVDYTPRASLGALWRQYFDYGKWKRSVLMRHPGSLKARQAGPPILVAGLLGAAVALVTPFRAAGLAIIGGYGLALVVAGIAASASNKDAAGMLSAPAIGVMHVSWGSGFLFGRTGKQPEPAQRS